ncbi:MAG: DUF6090 family protein [Gracilimonas sp.]|nr:DUF6090 family protein [Gracilimonas sp.]
MLKFFRTIRKKLIEEDNVRKYLLYAIGEILLVVIGILIALQVNNWNEDRIQRDQETHYLEKLAEEMAGIRAEAEYMLEFAKLQQKHARMVLESLQTGNTPDNVTSGEMLIAIQHNGWAPHPNFVSTVWDELKFTAKLSLIQDKTITDRAGKIYASIDRILSRENEFKDYNLDYRERAYEALSSEVRLSIIELLKPNEILMPYTNAPEVGPVLEQLKSMQQLQRILTDIIITRKITILFMDELVKDVDELIPIKTET